MQDSASVDGFVDSLDWIGLDWKYEVLYCIFNQAREILSCMLRAFVSREYAEI